VRHTKWCYRKTMMSFAHVQRYHQISSEHVGRVVKGHREQGSLESGAYHHDKRTGSVGLY